MNASILPRNEARRVNQAIDRCLLEPAAPETDALAQLSSQWGVSRVAERVCRRATILGKRERRLRGGIIRARDRLIQWLYAHAAPADWCVAWCDGSVRGSRAGIGGLVLAARDRMPVAEISAPAGAADAMSIELAAVIAVVDAAREGGAGPLRVYTDCDALVELWLHHRGDPRLVALCDSADGLRGFELRSIPRQHNQPAHRLARSAVAQPPADD